MTTTSSSLERVVGLPGATLLGLGSILGTGVFVSIAVGAGLAGNHVVIALVIAGLLASFNGLSAAQLAATFPVSGGTYEYGYRTLGPWPGFAAGWMFLCAKMASCATAALGSAGYLLSMINITDPVLIKTVAAGFTILITLLVSGGMKRSNKINAVIVFVTIASLITYVVICFKNSSDATQQVSETAPFGWYNFFQACALMFVAYTGYGRIATLGEEIKKPRKNIPIAVVITLCTASAIYILVATASIGVVGAGGFANASGHSGAALINIARLLRSDWLAILLTIASITAMIGVQLNLILGLSRVILAMGRRNDLPAGVAKIAADQSPKTAVFITGFFVLIIVLLMDFRASWSFSAFTVLLYYSLTNLAALRLKTNDRFVPKAVSFAGIIICLSLAAFVDLASIQLGVILLGIGYLVKRASNSISTEISQ